MDLQPPAEIAEVMPDPTNPRIEPSSNTPLMEKHYAELLKKVDEMDLATDMILMLQQQ